MEQSSDRIQYVDFMRGFAVIIMVMGHSIDSVLSIDERATTLFRLHDAVRGFTAPLFLFVAGYAFSVATEKNWAAYLSLSSPTLKRFGKIALLLIIGYALHFPFFSLHKILFEASSQEYMQFFQADVLHCVALSLLLLHLIIFVTRTPRAFARTTFGVAATVIVATPIVWSVDLAPRFSSILAPYLNQHQQSIFPLFPYASYLLAGAVTGHYFLEAKRNNREGNFFHRTVFLGVGVMISALMLDLIPISIYPPHDYWKASPLFFLIRLSIVLLIVVGFWAMRRIPPVAARQLKLLGQASLFVYVFHLVLVYGSAANNGLAQVVGQTLVYRDAFIVALLVLVVMVAIVHLWRYLRTYGYFPARFVQAVMAGTLFFYFFTNPY